MTVDDALTKEKRAVGQKVPAAKKKKLKDPEAPKKPATAFFLFCKDERPRVVEMLGTKLIGPVAVELSKRWANVDQEAKANWDAMAKVEKSKYEEQKEKYRPSEEFLLAAAAHEEKQAKKELKGDPNKIREKMSQYFTFLLSSWTKMALARPELSAQVVQQEVWLQWSTGGGKGSGAKLKGKKMKDPNAPKRPMSAYLIFLKEVRGAIAKEGLSMSNTEVMAEAGKRWKSLDEDAKAPLVEKAKRMMEEYCQEKTKYKENL